MQKGSAGVRHHFIKGRIVISRHFWVSRTARQVPACNRLPALKMVAAKWSAVVKGSPSLYGRTRNINRQPVVIKRERTRLN